MSDDKTKARMLKLLALARQGVGGEAQNAQTFLQKILDRHGMTMADLEDDQPTHSATFTWKTKEERVILVQAIARAINADTFRYKQATGKKAIRVELTIAQRVEVDLSMQAYAPALEKHLKLALSAFIQKNGIYPDAKPQTSEPTKPPSKEDLDAIIAMMRGMRATPVHKAIGHGAAA